MAENCSSLVARIIDRARNPERLVALDSQR